MLKLKKKNHYRIKNYSNEIMTTRMYTLRLFL